LLGEKNAIGVGTAELPQSYTGTVFKKNQQRQIKKEKMLGILKGGGGVKGQENKELVV